MEWLLKWELFTQSHRQIIFKKEAALGYHQRKGFRRPQRIVIVLLFCAAFVIHIENTYGQNSFAAYDINGDRTIDITDAIMGLQVLTGFPVTGLSAQDGIKIDLQKIVYALQVQAGTRDSVAHLVDWDGDGFNEFSGDCDETDPYDRPGHRRGAVYDGLQRAGRIAISKRIRPLRRRQRRSHREGHAGRTRRDVRERVLLRDPRRGLSAQGIHTR